MSNKKDQEIITWAILHSHYKDYYESRRFIGKCSRFRISEKDYACGQRPERNMQI